MDTRWKALMMVGELPGSSLLHLVWKKNWPKTRSKHEVKLANISEILQVLLREGACCPGALGEEVQQWYGSAVCILLPCSKLCSLI